MLFLEERETDFSEANNDSSHDEHDHKQNWGAVDMVAWVLLITISVECFIEGIAFVLVLQDAFGAGVAFLLAMLVKLVPQKLGDAVILSKAGLNHFWENLLSLLAVLVVYLGERCALDEKFEQKLSGAILGIVLEEELKDIAVYFFAALSGIFLYISLASLFPVLQDMIDDQVIIGKTHSIKISLHTSYFQGTLMMAKKAIVVSRCVDYFWLTWAS